MMTRCKADNWMKACAKAIAKHRGARKAKIALTHCLAVIMRRMWITNTPFPMERPAVTAA